MVELSGIISSFDFRSLPPPPPSPSLIVILNFESQLLHLKRETEMEKRIIDFTDILLGFPFFSFLPSCSFSSSTSCLNNCNIINNNNN